MNTLFVALGGTFGAVARYGVGLWLGNAYGFPLGTFLINIVGSFMLGMLNVFVLERTILPPEWRLGLGVGFLGAFTTFSTFSYETISLVEEGSYLLACGYAVSSVLLGLLAVFLGMYIARTV